MARPSKYPPEFREQTVELVRASGKTVVTNPADGLGQETLRPPGRAGRPADLSGPLTIELDSSIVPV